MLLRELINGISPISIQGNLEREVLAVTFDSRKVTEGSVFVAIKGSQSDGHAYIEKAVALGALAVVVESLPAVLAENVTWIVVERSSRALALLAANFNHNPAYTLVLVGVTGTNGKTSIATLLHGLFTELGHTCGLVSTIRCKIGTENWPATHTTPDPVQLHDLFARMLKAGCTFCFMEVSSHALDQDRAYGIPFRAALFTNLTRDHLDYHGTMDNYLRAKKLLFDQLGKEAVAIVSADDRNGSVMVQNTRAEIRTCSLSKLANYRAKMLDNTLEGLHLEVNGQQTWFRLRGAFNAMNLLMVYATGCELGEDPDSVLEVLSGLGGIEGRFEVIQDPETRITAVVDYAHTPDALQNTLETIKEANHMQARVLSLVGCGGDRDKGKRPEMAKIAARLSDLSIFTSDNPRSEKPEEIIRDMEAGLDTLLRRKTLSIVDRREAIRTLCRLAHPGDILLVAGKGHETYQEIMGERHPFDDRVEVRRAFEELTPNNP